MLLAGCGSPAEPVASGQAQSQETTGGQAKQAGDCPLTTEELSKATSLSWESKGKKVDYPLETLESVKATACLYTAADAPQEASDPLVLRTDIVTGAGVAALRKDFADSCTGYKGMVRDSAAADGAVVCDRDGATVEGLVGDADRVVSVYYVNADKATAAKLTKTFDTVLTAVA